MLAALLLLTLLGCGQPKAAPPTPTATRLLPTLTAVSTIPIEPTALATAVLRTPLPTPQPAPTANLNSPRSVVELERFQAFESAILGNSRDIRIFLPPNYRHPSNQRHYPVLYVNDGQAAGRWELRQTLVTLYRDRQIDPLIVVTIFNSDFRNAEYGVAGQPNANGEGNRADLYGRFVVEELKPAIDAHYRTLPEPEQTAVLGASLGGLSAFDLAWQHPDTFGMVGVMSGSFWWYDGGATESERVANRIVHRFVAAATAPPSLRIWLSAGTAERRTYRDGVGEITAVRDTGDLADLLMQQGYQKPAQLSYTVIPNGVHGAESWKTVLPQFLQWAFPPSPS